jgi:hypothetical protein
MPIAEDQLQAIALACRSINAQCSLFEQYGRSKKDRPTVRRLSKKIASEENKKPIKKYKPHIYSYRNTLLNIARSFLFTENQNTVSKKNSTAPR